jgi:hypothetical protein
MSITPPFQTIEPTGRPTMPPVMDSPPSQSPSEHPTSSYEPSESLEPSALVATERLVATPCDGDSTRTTTVTMEVELALNKPVNEYTADLDAALTKALGLSFPLCESAVRRRNSQRILEDGDLNKMHLGEIIVTDTGTECETQVESATTCRNVQIDVEEYGGTGQEDIAALIRFNIAENEDFDDELMQNGILAVRVTNESTDNGINESNSATSRSSASDGEKLTAGTTAVVVVASMAALTLIGTALMRQGSQRRRMNGTAYMEALDEYDCKSIDQSSQSQQTYDDTLPFAASVDSVGILGAMRRDSMSDGAPDSPLSVLRKRPSSP